ncbi:MAG TPA: hypothetical protein VFE58_08325 [Tepidisphaeraceae bacterium]|jgi:hypothetical protein|nr:hypothetical protein [Tepidisphaeraceae bacterium]
MTFSQPFIVTCPSCGKRLQVPAHLAGKRAKCSCGQSIVVPSMPGLPVQIAAAKEPSNSVTLGYRSPPAAHSETARAHEQTALIRQAILYSSLLLLLIGGIFAFRHFSSSKPAVPPPPSLGEDADVEKMIQEDNGTEARQWLADQHGRMLSGMNDNQAKYHIDEWYKMGATKVYAFGGGLSLSVALELPANPAQRKTLFDWVNQWHQGSHTPPMTDVGQKYLLVRLRL